MDTVLALIALVIGIGLIIGAADALIDGLVGAGRRLGVAPFVLTVAISGFELENIAAGIAANAKGLPGAAAGTVFGGITFLALGVAGFGALIAPMRSGLPRSFLGWTAVSPLAVLALGLDGELSRLDGAILLAWFALVLVGIARTGRTLLDPEAEPVSRPYLRLLGGLVGLTVGGALLGSGLRKVVTDSGSRRPCSATRRSPHPLRPRSSVGSPFPPNEGDRSLPWATPPARSPISQPSTPA